LYDEPFTGQDPISLGVLVNLIKHQNKIFGTTTILVSHDVAITCRMADEIYLLSERRIIAHGTALEMQTRADPAVKQFMHGEADGVVPFHYPANSYREELLND
jgi:phospholipid/cholesterol/gamma-HCH transport system ATP-binding protein